MMASPAVMKPPTQWPLERTMALSVGWEVVKRTSEPEQLDSATMAVKSTPAASSSAQLGAAFCASRASFSLPTGSANAGAATAKVIRTPKMDVKLRRFVNMMRSSRHRKCDARAAIYQHIAKIKIPSED